jgi:hypothetical protein
MMSESANHGTIERTTLLGGYALLGGMYVSHLGCSLWRGQEVEHDRSNEAGQPHPGEEG